MGSGSDKNDGSRRAVDVELSDWLSTIADALEAIERRLATISEKMPAPKKGKKPKKEAKDG